MMTRDNPSNADFRGNGDTPPSLLRHELMKLLG